MRAFCTILWVFLGCAMALPSCAFGEMKVGASKEEVIAELGPPTGTIDRRAGEIYFYEGGAVEFEGGRVARFDAGIAKRTARKRAQAMFVEMQTAKGLVEHNGLWVTPMKKKELELRDRLKDPIRVISSGGARVNIGDLLVPGMITIIDFCADWSEACTRTTPHLEEVARTETDVFLRRVDIISWNSEVAQQYKLGHVPNLRVFDANGRMVGKPTQSLYRVKDYIEAARRP